MDDNFEKYIENNERNIYKRGGFIENNEGKYVENNGGFFENMDDAPPIVLDEGNNVNNGTTGKQSFNNISKGTMNEGVSSENEILVHGRQKKNPVLKYFKIFKWRIAGNIDADFVFNGKSCALFISLRYHLQNPTYTKDKVKSLGNQYHLRILICFVNYNESTEILREINIFCIENNLTLILVWSNIEAARYIETYFSIQSNGGDSIKKKLITIYILNM